MFNIGLKKNQEQNKNKFGRNMTEQIPILSYEDGYFIFKDNRLMNIFEIEGKSFYNANEDELSNQVHRLAEYYRMQKEDIKFIFMNYPANTSKQQVFIEEKMKIATPAYKRWLQKELNILQNLEKHRTDKVAFIFIYADNENSYNRQVELLKQKSTLSVKDVSLDKKITILRKLNNMNNSIKV